MVDNGRASTQTPSDSHEQQQDPMHLTTSNTSLFWNGTDVPEVARSSSVQNLDTNGTGSNVLQHLSHSCDSRPDVIDASPIKANLRQSENCFPSLFCSVLSELGARGVPIAQYFK